MDKQIQNETEMAELKCEKFFGTTKRPEMNEEAMPPREQDMMLSMIVLLIACLALAGLAHIIV